MPVPDLYTTHPVIASVQRCHASGASFRRIALDVFEGRVSHAVVARMNKGIEPREEATRIAVGLPVDPIPQVEMRVCSCGCSQAFWPATWNQVRIHGHPRRRR